MSDQEAKDRLAQALIASQAVGTAPPSPYVLDQSLESAASPNSPALHPLINAIMRHVGLFNVMRNKRNEQLVDPEAAP